MQRVTIRLAHRTPRALLQRNDLGSPPTLCYLPGLVLPGRGARLLLVVSFTRRRSRLAMASKRLRLVTEIGPMRCAVVLTIVFAPWWSAGPGRAGEVAYADLAVNGGGEPAVIVATPIAKTARSVAPVSFEAPPAPTPAYLTDSEYAPTHEYPPVYESTPSIAPVTYDACSHWFAGVDLGVTAVSFTTGGFAVADDEVGLSLRPYVGWESYEGTGFRVRGWFYGVDTQAVAASTLTPFDLEISAASLDIDFYKRLQVDATSLVLGAGSRAAGTSLQLPDGSENSWGGGGLSAFADIYHPFRTTPHSEWGWTGGARLSYLTGEIEFAGDDPYSEADSIVHIGEAHLGIQYRRHFERSDFVFQVQAERAAWQSNVMNDIAFATTNFRFGWEW
jgi:hypothetical protein